MTGSQDRDAGSGQFHSVPAFIDRVGEYGVARNGGRKYGWLALQFLDIQKRLTALRYEDKGQGQVYSVPAFIERVEEYGVARNGGNNFGWLALQFLVIQNRLTAQR